MIICSPLAFYGLHDQNSFTSHAALVGVRSFERSSDQARLATLLALQHISNKFDFFHEHCDSESLKITISTLFEKSFLDLPWFHGIAKILAHLLLRVQLKLLRKKMRSEIDRVAAARMRRLSGEEFTSFEPIAK